MCVGEKDRERGGKERGEVGTEDMIDDDNVGEKYTIEEIGIEKENKNMSP